MDIIPLQDKIDEVLEKVVVLLMVINESEQLATLSNLKALDGYDKILKYSQCIDHGGQRSEIAEYYIGCYGACPAAVRIILAGSEIDGGASSVPDMAYKCFPSLDAIIGVGVACGVEDKVDMCDVLVSSKIAAYNSARAENGQYTPRGDTVSASAYLRNLFSQNFKWPSQSIKDRLKSGNMRIPEVKTGVILSGPYLIDDPKLKKQFIKDFATEAKGIEMEGCYVFGAAKRATTHLIIVKAVCDFGDGNKGKDYQPTAALLAADLVKESFNNPDVAKMLKKKR